jgi:hypothetical protein
MEIFSKGFVKYAKNITEKSSEKNASEKGDTQDTISELIAGIRRAKELQHSYPLANYHHTMFSFQQEFHSSYRARKGKVLEEVLKKFCRDSGYIVHKKKSEKWGAIAKSLNLEEQQIVSENSKADVDLVAESEKCLLVIQIRSRDDTGGTTAKGSLAKALIPIVKTAITNQQKKDIIYLVAVWEPRREEQFSSLVDELVERLREVLGNMDSLPSDKSIIKQRIRNDNGLEVCDRIFIRVAYGIEEIEQVVSKGSSEENRIEKHTLLSERPSSISSPSPTDALTNAHTPTLSNTPPPHTTHHNNATTDDNPTTTQNCAPPTNDAATPQNPAPHETHSPTLHKTHPTTTPTNPPCHTPRPRSLSAPTDTDATPAPTPHAPRARPTHPQATPTPQAHCLASPPRCAACALLSSCPHRTRVPPLCGGRYALTVHR